MVPTVKPSSLALYPSKVFPRQQHPRVTAVLAPAPLLYWRPEARLFPGPLPSFQLRSTSRPCSAAGSVASGAVASFRGPILPWVFGSTGCWSPGGSRWGEYLGLLRVPELSPRGDDPRTALRPNPRSSVRSCGPASFRDLGKAESALSCHSLAVVHVQDRLRRPWLRASSPRDCSRRQRARPPFTVPGIQRVWVLLVVLCSRPPSKRMASSSSLAHDPRPRLRVLGHPRFASTEVVAGVQRRASELARHFRLRPGLPAKPSRHPDRDRGAVECDGCGPLCSVVSLRWLPPLRRPSEPPSPLARSGLDGSCIPCGTRCSASLVSALFESPRLVMRCLHLAARRRPSSKSPLGNS